MRPVPPKYEALAQRIIESAAETVMSATNYLMRSEHDAPRQSVENRAREVVLRWLFEDGWIDEVAKHVAKAIVEDPSTVTPAPKVTQEDWTRYEEGAKALAGMLRRRYDAYRAAGFSNDDTMRLVLQDNLVVQAGDKQVVQGLSFSDLLPRSWRTPEELR